MNASPLPVADTPPRGQAMAVDTPRAIACRILYSTEGALLVKGRGAIAVVLIFLPSPPALLPLLILLIPSPS